MKINGSDCSIIIKTEYRAIDVPYSEETIREAFSLLEEKPSIEGEGNCKAIRKSNGVTGCIITPLTIETAPLLLYLAMGSGRLGLSVLCISIYYALCNTIEPKVRSHWMFTFSSVRSVNLFIPLQYAILENELIGNHLGRCLYLTKSMKKICLRRCGRK
jgi:hypothetical protein